MVRSRLSRYRRIHNRIIADVMQLTVFEYEHHIASLDIENFLLHRLNELWS